MEKTRLSISWRGVGATDNLAELSKLDEQIILDELRARYMQDKIYTYVGDILIAVNPFKDLQIYDKKIAYSYKNSKLHTDPPHIYAIVSHVYRCMLGAEYNTEPQDQCIVISGESGAGKTESTKFVVKQIIELCNGNTQLEQQILQVNPLLEAFGNAKTVINDNSSRFGKYIQLQFNSGSVVGAKISEYLLEKSRVVNQNTGDENFHIFSYMLAGCSPEQRALYKLKPPKEYRYTRTNDKVEREPAKLQHKFEELQNAMDLVGFSEEEQTDLMAILSGVLSVGNIDFAAQSANEDKVNIAGNEELNLTAGLFGIDTQELRECLTRLTNKTRGEHIQIDFNKHQAEDARDAIAKVIYGRLFSWIVNKINQRLAPQNRSTDQLEIGILDIFGFENFTSNSFEQACINLANEHLQFFFNEHIFSLEQDEYKSEGVKWTHISYSDNQALLDLFLKRPIGILALLDEESHFPRATDATFVRKLNDNLSSYPCYKSHKSVTKPSFTINHYAGEVTYDVKNWLEKNRDTIPPSLMSILKRSSNDLLRMIFKGTLTRTGTLALQNRTRKSIFSKRSQKPVVPTNTKKFTVGTQFKNSLQDLIKHMSQAEPHFIRCLKPNDHQQPAEFDQSYVLSQLRYTGMLQTVQIRRDGYALRPHIEDFINTYKILLYHPDVLVDGNTCKQILSRANVTDWHVGKTKVFLKSFHAEALSKRLSELTQATIKVQAAIRGFVARRYVKKLREVSEQQKLYVEDFLKAVAGSSDGGLVRQENIIKQEKVMQEQEQQKRLEEEREQKRLEKLARKKSKENITQKPVERSESPSVEHAPEKKGLPIPAHRPSLTLDSGYGGDVPAQALVQPQRPAKPDRLSMYSQLSDFSEGGNVADRRHSRLMNDPLPPVPPMMSPSSTTQPLPQPPRPPSLIHSPTQSHPDSNRHSILMHRKQMVEKQKSVVDKFSKFGYSSSDDLDDDIIEDDFSAIQEETHPYGPPNTRSSTIEWFKQTQAGKLYKPFTTQFYDWFHGIIPRGKAEKMLLMKEIGAFMIRLSEKRFGYVLSFRAETRCRHYMVDPTPSNKFVIVGEPKVHKTLAHLVDFHQQNVISNWSGVLTITCGQMNPQLPDYKDLIPDNPLPNDYAEAEEYITTMSSKAGSVKSESSIPPPHPTTAPPLPPKLHSKKASRKQDPPNYISYK